MTVWGLFWLTTLVVLPLSFWLPSRLSRARPRLRKWTTILAMNLAAALWVLVLGEAWIRREGERPYTKTFPGEQENDLAGVPWAEADPELGWVCNRGVEGTNPQGFRDARDFAAPAAETRVMMLGDSFVWGAGVAASETIPALLERELGAGQAVFNLGVAGWGLDQMYLAYLRYRDVLRPAVVVLAYIDDDLHRVLEAYRTAEKMNKPSFVVDEGELLARGPPSALQSGLNHLTKNSALLGFALRNHYARREARPVVEWLFTTMARETRARGERLVVLRIPTRDEETPLARMRRSAVDRTGVLEREGIALLDPARELGLIPGWQSEGYFGDGHLSDFGTRQVASYLARRAFRETRSAADKEGRAPFKGVAGYDCSARTALNAGWYYNWTQEHDGCAAGGEFVPMIWGHRGAEQSARGITGALERFVALGHRNVLGFNEPDQGNQANIGLEAALALWPAFDNPALRLGTPGTSAGPDGVAWFTGFMQQLEAQPALRADFLAIHWYAWSRGSAEPDARRLETHIRWAEGLPGKRPIWITEFGCLNKSATDEETVVRFFRGALEVFARHPRVERYAWFPFAKHCALVNEDGSLTALGREFAAAPAYK